MKLRIILFSLIIVFIAACDKESETPDPFAGDSGSFTDDRDGNEYAWVRIGDQVWMAENLAYLPEVFPSADGSEDAGKENDPFYYVYDYQGTDVSVAKGTLNYNTYGVLYNIKAAMMSCPDGWHVPSDAEWIELEQELGITEGLQVFNVWRGTDEGGMLKEAGTTHWQAPNSGASDVVSFKALPGGSRLGGFNYLGQSAFLHSSSTHSDFPTSYIFRVLGCDRSTIIRTFSSSIVGNSVRCIKD